jgi:hypothetical protein
MTVPPLQPEKKTQKTATMASTDFDLKAKEAIPAEVHMISGSHDIQTSADVSNVGAFQVSSVV